MAIDFDFDDEIDEIDELDFELDALDYELDELELELDEYDEFPLINYEEGDEIDLLPKKKRKRTIFPCMK